jgi:hypothetical protein
MKDILKWSEYMGDYEWHISPYHGVANTEEVIMDLLERSGFTDGRLFFEKKQACYPDKAAVKGRLTKI